MHALAMNLYRLTPTYNISNPSPTVLHDYMLCPCGLHCILNIVLERPEQLIHKGVQRYDYTLHD